MLHITDNARKIQRITMKLKLVMGTNVLQCNRAADFIGDFYHMGRPQLTRIFP